MRGVGELFHPEGEAEITQNELADLANQKIVANLGEKGKIPQLQEAKEKERKNRTS